MNSGAGHGSRYSWSMEQHDGAASWTFLSNHACVLAVVAADPDIRVRDIALRTGITERAAHEILRQLVDGGFLVVEKHGRRNHYRVEADQPMRRPQHRARHVSELLAALVGTGAGPEA